MNDTKPSEAPMTATEVREREIELLTAISKQLEHIEALVRQVENIHQHTLRILWVLREKTE